MKVTQVAELLRVHRSTIYRMAQRGEIPAFRKGNDWRFRSEEIDRWRRSHDHGDWFLAVPHRYGAVGRKQPSCWDRLFMATNDR